MANDAASVVICGAGYAGITTAYQLAVKRDMTDIVLVDPQGPLGLTSSKGTEGYRNWWPDATMMQFINHSIDLLEEGIAASGHLEWLNRRGYLFLTSDPQEAEVMRQQAQQVASLGAGAYREHPGATAYQAAPPFEFRDQPDGIDFLRDPDLIRHHFPFVRDDILAAIHVRRAGFFDSWNYGQWMLAEVQARGGRVLQDRITAVDTTAGRVHAVELESGQRLETEAFVIAAGPYLKSVAQLLEIDLPLVNELHAKFTIPDVHRVIPRESPMMIWNNKVDLAWTETERQDWAADPATRWLLETVPAGVHVRPRGEQDVLLIWTFDVDTMEQPIYPPPFNPHYAEVVIRGLADMIPDFKTYFGQGNPAHVDGGYYCKTPENRPLIGPLPVQGAYVVGALSGYGLMSSAAAGDLIATHVAGETLPAYAPEFLLSRYDDPGYQAAMAKMDPAWGQL